MAWSWWENPTPEERQHKYYKLDPLNEEQTKEQCIFFGNNGIPLNRSDKEQSGEAYIKHVCYENAKKFLTEKKTNKIVIYAHGGTVKEEVGLSQAASLAPVFICENIFPIFVIWKTGVAETLLDLVWDNLLAKKIVTEEEAVKGGYVAPDETCDQKKAEENQKLRDATTDEEKDAFVEKCAQKVAKPIWTEMKQNAKAAAGPNRALTIMISELVLLKKEFPNLEIHLASLSAGSYICGYLFDILKENNLKNATCSLFAPACTTQFANERYLNAINNCILNAKDLHFNILTDRREREDACCPIYHKSLLYLTSRGCEDPRKTAIFGMAGSWPNLNEDIASDIWDPSQIQYVKTLTENQQNLGIPLPVTSDVLSHASFVNNITIMSNTCQRILKYTPC